MADDVGTLLAGVRFVLVSPLQSGNIGGVARAMKNMGVTDLAVVQPRALDIDRARWMAPGAADVLDGGRWTADVVGALEGCHAVYATTARDRHDRWPAHEPAGFADLALAQLAIGKRVAVLFGPEDTGLGNDALRHADGLIHIPTDVHASLNLAQAALLVGSALFNGARERGLVPRVPGEGKRGGQQRGAPPGPSASRVPVDVAGLEPLLTEWMASLELGTYLRGHDPEMVLATLRRILGRAELDHQDVTVLRGMLRKMRWKMGARERE